jgi:chemotaxis response regulator CheB
MTDARKARAVLCIKDAKTKAALLGALDRCGFFDVVGEAKNGSELELVLHDEYPDVVMVDTAVTGKGVEAFLLEASAGRPIPALALEKTETSSKRSRKSRKWKIYKLGKDVLLNTDLLSQNHVWARLLALADQVTAVRHTQTATRLDEMIKAERIRARHSGQRPEIVTLATWPLDLIVLAGGLGADEQLARVLPGVPACRVPVMIAVDGSARLDTRVFDLAKTPVDLLRTTVSVRRSSGLVVCPATGRVSVSPEDIVIEPTDEPLSAAATVTSAGALGSGVLLVQLSDDQTAVAQAAATILNGGGIVVAINADECKSPDGSVAMSGWDYASTRITLDELTWLLSHAVPRRM